MANEAKEKLIAGLNDDLALELAGIVRSVYQASTAGGLLGHELRELLQKELPVELQHAQFLADKIAILGGTPTTSIAEVPLPDDRRGYRNRMEDRQPPSRAGQPG